MMVSKLVPFEFEQIRYCFEATIPTHWYLVSEKEFDRAMSDVNWNRSWYSNCCLYKDYNKTLGSMMIGSISGISTRTTLRRISIRNSLTQNPHYHYSNNLFIVRVATGLYPEIYRKRNADNQERLE